MARTGKHNSNSTCIEETALNLLYKGMLSMKKSVNRAKFLPQDKINETIAPDRKIYLIFLLSINKATIHKKKTTTPI
jgi:hypothetical protein